MSVTTVIRILQFRPRRVDIDSVLREQFIPALRSRADLLDLVAGRHGPDELGPRIVASVWASGAAQARTTTGDPVEPDDTTRLPDVDEVRLEVLPVRIRFWSGVPDTARVLRVFRGRVRAGHMARYLSEAETGTRDDAAAGRGPVALYLAADESADGFVTVSTWYDWSVIEAATGGDIRSPVATRHPDRLVAAEATHYEVIDA